MQFHLKYLPSSLCKFTVPSTHTLLLQHQCKTALTVNTYTSLYLKNQCKNWKNYFMTPPLKTKLSPSNHTFNGGTDLCSSRNGVSGFQRCSLFIYSFQPVEGGVVIPWRVHDIRWQTAADIVPPYICENGLTPLIKRPVMSRPMQCCSSTR